MLPGLALVLLAAWTARALEVGVALRNGGRGGGVEPVLPKSLILRSRGQSRGPRSPPRPTPPLAVALRILASGPAGSRGRTLQPAERERGEASGSRVRAVRGRGEEAILSSDPNSVPASRPRAGTGKGEGRADGAHGVKPKTQRPWILSPDRNRCPSLSLGRWGRGVGTAREAASLPRFPLPFPPRFTFPPQPRRPATASLPDPLCLPLPGGSRWPPRATPTRVAHRLPQANFVHFCVSLLC